MIDRLVRGLYPSRGLRALFVRTGDTARMARMLHGLSPTAAHLFAEGLAAGALVGALQKDTRGRVNLQVAGDGPLRGLFVDADPEGNVRGYVRAPAIHLPGDPAEAARVALGTSGFLSVIRDHGSGQFYRSAVELGADGLAGALRRWFTASEQVATAVDLCVVPRAPNLPAAEGGSPGAGAEAAPEPLGDVVGVLVQRLPGGSDEAVAEVRERLLAGALRAALTGGGASATGPSAQEVLRAVAFEGFELLADQEIAYRCGCSLARATSAVSALGADGVAEVIAGEGKAEVSCEFCHAHYVLDRPALEDLERRLRQVEPEPEPEPGP
ncbi:MAG: Hsp33 family molecular chaperone HslO [Anaeromyxobacter sp.]|nr:Hsp33 family molecular chaperone HslO [Anaeromyxobacter sp.]MBL0275266.1 Hsp33 family molecular chaperone HslO [Anaeromyxobacter sp.]